MDTQVLRQIMEVQRDLYFGAQEKVFVYLTESFMNAPVEDVLRNHPHKTIVGLDAERPGQKFSLSEKTFLEEWTIGWIISNVSLSHSVGAKMIEHGMFVISNPGMTEDWAEVLKPENAKACRQTADALERAICGDVGGIVYITADDGTDLTLEVPNENWMKEVGKRLPGEVGTNGIFGEFCTAPYQANGTYVLQPSDFLTNPINKVGGEVRIIIRNNEAIRIEQSMYVGRENRKSTLYDTLLEASNPLAFNLGEFSISINPAQPVNVKTSVVAEKLLGGIHIAIGTNAVCLKADCPDIAKFQHGRYNADVHIDCIKFGATVTFMPEGKDEEILLLQNGKLMV
jgi:leucyl aminopeptidase (aminopeptidase T)